MTRVTHQMIALLSTFWLLIIYPLSVGPVLALLATLFTMVGALFPDIDQPTANIWHQFVGGRAAGKVFSAFSGGHRNVTHSALGLVLVGWGLNWVFQQFFKAAYQPGLHYIWLAFMIGYLSHLIADTMTDRGVPWLWPLPISIKIPPGPEEVRVTTGSFVEMVLLRLGIIVAATILLYSHWPVLVQFFR